jgi:hypothetical protein
VDTNLVFANALNGLFPFPDAGGRNTDLEDFLGSYPYKEEVQDLLDPLDLPVSGVKDELVERLLDGLARLTEGETQPFFDRLFRIMERATLKEACEAAEPPTSGTKEELFERLIDAILEEEVEEPEEVTETPVG